MKIGVFNLKEIHDKKFRFDPSLLLSEGIRVRSLLNKLPYEVKTLSEVSTNIFIGNIFSRQWVKDSEKGLPYLSASDTVLADLNTRQYLSILQAKQLSELLLDEGWILITCSGTLGKTSYTNKNYTGRIATHDLIRVVPNCKVLSGGYLYAFLRSKYGYFQITQSQFGGVVKHINATQAGELQVPILPDSIIHEINDMITTSSYLRQEATQMLNDAERILKEKAGLRDLSPDDYEYFGFHDYRRTPGCFSMNIRELKYSFAAFNHSERFRRALSEIDSIPNMTINDAISSEGWISPGGVEVVELKEGHGIQLINQSDIFDNLVTGKWVKFKSKYIKDTLKYGDVVIAKIGTLGENEKFCHCVFANEDLDGVLISSAFYILRSSDRIPSGYLFCWLNSEWGFRQLRSSQFGTKLCYPNPSIVGRYKMPILQWDDMIAIDKLVKDAHTKRHRANQLELESIAMIESEIAKNINSLD